ncbi:hypothetical protein [Parasitella parasitica]|uniref:Uncharacterized protein n=1 Tax=Parasitella parasitica TaxID=35722 RepID=A0A0B7NY56_9FUNG|nr:hypothetical protein [Parasitella parasitica]
MTAVRGPYNKSSQRTPLTDDQLKALSQGFIEHRKTVPCPNCKIPTVFRTKGKSKAINHEKEYQYLCTVCNRIMHADDMLALVTRPVDMEEDSQPLAIDSQLSALDSQLPDVESQPPFTSSQPPLSQFELELNLKEQLNDKQQRQLSTVTPNTLQEDFPALLVPNYQSAPWHQPQQTLSLTQIVSKNQQKREAAAARLLQPPSNTQGFQYLYLPTKARIPLGKLRTTLKKLRVNNGRILDLHYPDRNIVAVLVHNDYVPELTELLSKKGVNLITTFDPCAVSVLKDPQYATNTPEERQQIAQQLHNQRAQKALTHIRGPAKFAVARFFAHKLWITQTQLAAVLATDPYLSTDPATEDIFVTNINASAVTATSGMDEDETLPADSQ